MKKQFKILIKIFVFLGTILISHQMVAMDRSEAYETITLDSKWAPKALRSKVPRKITIFDRDTILTDEFFAHINPKWQRLKDQLTQDEKNELLGKANCILRGDHRYHERRCLLSALVALGADANVIGFGESIVEVLVLHDDLPLVHYVLKKINKAEVDSEEIYENVLSVPMAEALMAAGIKPPKSVLHYCCTQERSLDLLNYYLEQGVDPNYLDDEDEDGLSVLFECTFDQQNLMYVPSLLNFGACLDQKISEKSIFHVAGAQFCACVIHHLLKQYEAIVAYLGCVKKKMPDVYVITRLFRTALVPYSSPLQKLKHALELKNAEGKTAYEMSGWEILNPANCTYKKLKALLQEQMHMENEMI